MALRMLPASPSRIVFGLPCPGRCAGQRIGHLLRLTSGKAFITAREHEVDRRIEWLHSDQ